MGERRGNPVAIALAVLLIVVAAVALAPQARAQDDTWYGEYFATQHLVGAPVFTRNDANIDFEWGEEAPDPRLPKDGFAVRWSKYEQFEAGTYTFFTTTDDGVRLYVDDLPVVNNWKEYGETTRTATVQLSAGVHALRMEVFDSTGNATAMLRWEQSSGATPGSPAATATPTAARTGTAAATTSTPAIVEMVTPTPTPAAIGATPSAAGTAAPSPAAGIGGTVYIVQRGDTLRSLAARFGITVDALLAANLSIRADRLFIGQRLVVPSGAVTPGSGAGTGTPAATGTPVAGSGTGGTPAAGGSPTNTSPATAGGEARGTVTPEATATATAVAGGSSTPTPAPGATGRARTGRTVQLFFVSEGTGNVGCGDEIVGVQRELPRNAAPLRGTLSLLLAEKDERYGESGLYNALHQSDLRIQRISRQGRLWTVELSGTLTLGGACDNPRVLEQLKQTALQFPTVREVRFLLNGEELEQVLSEQ